MRLAERLVRKGQACRIVSLVDSNVIRCAASKGRSSSRALTPFLCRYGALCIAGGLYFSLPFVPTRLNTSDDPTRDRPVREPLDCIPVVSLNEEDIEALDTVVKLRRWASNWVRLCSGLFGFHGLHFVLSGQRRHGLPWISSHAGSTFAANLDHPLEFDQTIGFPGEGPLLLAPFLIASLLFLSPLCSWQLAALVLGGACFTRCHGMLGPKTQGDWRRRAARLARPPLPQGRPVTAATSENREKLLKEFFNWCSRAGFDMQAWLELPTRDLESINEVYSFMVEDSMKLDGPTEFSLSR